VFLRYGWNTVISGEVTCSGGMHNITSGVRATISHVRVLSHIAYRMCL